MTAPTARPAAPPDNDFTYCAYCGQEFPLDGDGGAVAEHIRGCVRHPMYHLRRLAVRVVGAWRRVGRCHAEFPAEEHPGACREYEDALDKGLAELERELRYQP